MREKGIVEKVDLGQGSSWTPDAGCKSFTASQETNEGIERGCKHASLWLMQHIKQDPLRVEIPSCQKEGKKGRHKPFPETLAKTRRNRVETETMNEMERRE